MPKNYNYGYALFTRKTPRGEWLHCCGTMRDNRFEVHELLVRDFQKNGAVSLPPEPEETYGKAHRKWFSVCLRKIRRYMNGEPGYESRVMRFTYTHSNPRSS
jgi:hypothetical protein